MILPKLKFSNGILWNEPGFSLEVQKVTRSSDRFLKVDSLNPQAEIKMRMTRLQTFRIGLFFILRSIFAKQPH